MPSLLFHRTSILNIIHRNCSFVQEAHRVILSPESDLNTLSFVNDPVRGIDVLPRILLPLAGPEEYDLEV